MLDGELMGLKFLNEQDENVAHLKLTKNESERRWKTHEVPRGTRIVGIKCHIKDDYIKRIGFQIVRPLQQKWK